MKIAISGGKGGTGKSTIATMIAVYLSEKKKTMLVDCDVECPNDYLLLNTELEFHKNVFQVIPKWDFSICNKCGKCAEICKQNAIIFVNGKFPAFLSEKCIGCKACIASCPVGAISVDKKAVGKIYFSDIAKPNIALVTGELNIGDLASGEIVSELRTEAGKINNVHKCENVIIDSAAGIGCPVIASIVNNDFVIAVTEPTPVAFSDLKRIIKLSVHFDIPIGVVINKFDIDSEFAKKIEDYLAINNMALLGKIPYDKDIMKLSGSFEAGLKKEFREIVKNIIFNSEEMIRAKESNQHETKKS